MKLKAKKTRQVIKTVKSNVPVREIVKLIKNQKPKNVDNFEEINILVDYSKTVEQAVIDGNYDWKNSSINSKNFSTPLELLGKKIEVFVKLFHFDRNIKAKEAIHKITKAGYRIPTMMELLALGETYPELQRNFVIVALGPVWHGPGIFRFVPGLDSFAFERRVSLYLFGGNWPAKYRFVGVKI